MQGTHLMEFELTVLQCVPVWVWIVTGCTIGKCWNLAKTRCKNTLFYVDQKKITIFLQFYTLPEKNIIYYETRFIPINATANRTMCFKTKNNNNKAGIGIGSDV